MAAHGLTLIPWPEVRQRIRASMSPRERARWDRESIKARHRYRSEIRQHRGIPRLRRMYARRWR